MTHDRRETHLTTSCAWHDSCRSVVSHLAYIVPVGEQLQDNGAFPSWHQQATARTGCLLGWPAMMVRDTEKQNETRQCTALYMVPSKTSFETARMESRAWCGRGCRVEAMCKNSHCSPFPELKAVCTLPQWQGGGPAHTPCDLLGKWAPWRSWGISGDYPVPAFCDRPRLLTISLPSVGGDSSMLGSSTALTGHGKAP